MPALWEAVVAGLCREATGTPLVPGTPPVRGMMVTEDTRPRKPFRPDVLVRADRATVAVDAKYKDYAGQNVSVSDIHQLLTYCAWYTPQNPRAVIVYPSGRSAASRTLRIGDPFRTPGTVDVVGVDVGAPPGDSVPQLRSVLAPLVAAP